MTDEFCPECGDPLEYDEVDIGVGVQRGNYGCPSCGWTPRAHDEIEEDDPRTVDEVIGREEDEE